MAITNSVFTSNVANNNGGAMYGYNTEFKGYDVTPEFGLRYMYIDQEKYTDKLGTVVSSNQEDLLTLIASAKIAKDYTLENGMVLRP